MNVKKLNKIELKELPAKLLPILQKIRRYGVVIFIVVVFILYSYLVLKVNTLAKKEPSEDVVTERLLTIKQLRVNQADIDKMLGLEDNSSEVKALFKQARENPFHE
ncbi:MAG TPA: hypothetical protein VJJ78_02085 [Candidatus Saccharimonadales bacterium]|nr:hypothetical protein [Candidatus Saccharimonadales bacterium]